MDMLLKELMARIPVGVRVVAVSKKQPLEKVKVLYEQGQLDFGENYAQELIEKANALQDLKDLRWHFIGNLQKNKAKHLVGKVHFIHSVGTFSLACWIDELAVRMGVKQKILLQLNLAHEPTKSGFTDRELEIHWEELKALTHLEICGFMTLPPLFQKAEDVRPFFRRLRELRDEYVKDLPSAFELSMGTSHDFHIAIEEGATIVRLGTLIFGERSN